MELRQLRYFLAVAEEGRFNRAAARLRIAAPSLSQQIRSLERELQIALFERSPQRVDLTPAGHALVERARVILAEVDRARAEVRIAGGRTREVNLRVANLAELALDRALMRSALDLPGFRLSVSCCREDDAFAAVRSGRADAAVVWRRSASDRDLDGLVLGSVLFGVVLPLGHAAAGAETVPIGSMINEALVMFPREPFVGVWDRIVDHFLPDGARSGQIKVEPNLLNAPEAVLRAVAAGSGVAAGIIGGPDRPPIDGVVVRRLEPDLWLDLEVVWRAPARDTVRELVDILVELAGNPGSGISVPGPAAAAAPVATV